MKETDIVKAIMKYLRTVPEKCKWTDQLERRKRTYP